MKAKILHIPTGNWAIVATANGYYPTCLHFFDSNEPKIFDIDVAEDTLYINGDIVGFITTKTSKHLLVSLAELEFFYAN